MASASGYDLNTIPGSAIRPVSGVPCTLFISGDGRSAFSLFEDGSGFFLLLRVLPLVMVVLFLLRFLLIR